MASLLDVRKHKTVVGPFGPQGAEGRNPRYNKLIAHWRVATIKTQTVDEYGVLFRNLFSLDNIEEKHVRGIGISSVVPPMDSTLREVCERHFHLKPLLIAPGITTGMAVHYD